MCHKVNCILSYSKGSVWSLAKRFLVGKKVNLADGMSGAHWCAGFYRSSYAQGVPNSEESTWKSMLAYLHKWPAQRCASVQFIGQVPILQLFCIFSACVLMRMWTKHACSSYKPLQMWIIGQVPILQIAVLHIFCLSSTRNAHSA